MKTESRKNKIIELLKRDGSVRVTTLSKTLGVSEVTVRNYLADLEEKGLLSRVCGGAVFSYKPYYSMNFNQRLNTNRAQKEHIAKFAASLVEPDDTIMLNAGTTTLLLFRNLPSEYRLNILTNSISIALESLSNPNFNVKLVGGGVNAKYQFTFGDEAIDMLRSYHATKAFLSVDGIDFEHGFSTYHEEGTRAERAMIAQSESVVIVADSTKIHRRAFAHVCELSKADFIVTDYAPTKEEQAVASQNGFSFLHPEAE